MRRANGRKPSRDQGATAYTAEQRETLRRCASLPGSSPAPTFGVRSPGQGLRHRRRRRTGELAIEPLAAPESHPQFRSLALAQGVVFAALALPQNRLQYNVLQGITCEQFPLHNEMLGHCRGKQSIDNWEATNSTAKWRDTSRTGP